MSSHLELLLLIELLGIHTTRSCLHLLLLFNKLLLLLVIVHQIGTVVLGHGRLQVGLIRNLLRWIIKNRLLLRLLLELHESSLLLVGGGLLIRLGSLQRHLLWVHWLRLAVLALLCILSSLAFCILALGFWTWLLFAIILLWWSTCGGCGDGLSVIRRGIIFRLWLPSSLLLGLLSLLRILSHLAITRLGNTATLHRGTHRSLLTSIGLIAGFGKCLRLRLFSCLILLLFRLLILVYKVITIVDLHGRIQLIIIIILVIILKIIAVCLLQG